MTEQEQWPVTQKLVDEAHDVWQQQDSVSYIDLLAQLDERHLVAMVVGKLNAQVCNGGFDQWWANGYGKGQLPDQVIEKLEAIEGKATRQVRAMIERFTDLLADFDNDGDPSDSSVYLKRVDALDSKFYKVNEAFMDEVEAWLVAQK